MERMTKIVLTGGGTAGHVIGNLAILPGLQKRGYELAYIGSHQGIERDLIQKEGIPYHPIASGKLRRYRSLRNVTDVFRVMKGLFDALRVLRKEKPDLIFSKGGYVTVPVAIAAALLRIPFIGHESDITPGLANKLAARYATKMLVTFPETKTAFGDKGIVVGSPVRQELFSGDTKAAYKFLQFEPGRPVLLVMGGSLGAGFLNDTVWANLDRLLMDYQVVHLVGKGNINHNLDHRPGYRQLEYIGLEMKDVLTLADFIVSRAGSNSIFEFLALKKPNLLIPLDLNQSRGDQIENAKSFAKAGYSLMLREGDFTTEAFFDQLNKLQMCKTDFIKNMDQAVVQGSLEKILGVIDETLENQQRYKRRKQPIKQEKAPFFEKNIDKDSEK
jgi:UDP-N-acetylglucosamine--N-acetylmuramyl-(pentapeptide) pyrophosphoryl-undecaprenol N-acetylglucosamine transferase